MKYRPDGSIESSNQPNQNQRSQTRDYGLYLGIIRERVYSDNDENGTQETTKEVLYTVESIGGDHDGELFRNCRILKDLGGRNNSKRTVLHPTKIPLGVDPANPLYPVPLENQTGDFVYFQFLNGSKYQPVIVGSARHPQASEAEAEESEGPLKEENFNGIKTNIDKNGTIRFTKSLGFYTPVSFLDVNRPLTPYEEEFVPVPGLEDAFVLELKGTPDPSIPAQLGADLSLTWNTGMVLEAKPVDDTFGFSTAAGASYTLSGLTDSHEFGTTVGTSVQIQGTSDSIELASSVGAGIKVDGLGDTVTVSTAAGAKIEVSGAGGVTVTDLLGNVVSLSSSGIELSTPAGGALNINPAGLITLGNNTAELLDLIDQAFTALSTQVASGFGAPTSTVAQFTALAAQIKLLKG